MVSFQRARAGSRSSQLLRWYAVLTTAALLVTVTRRDSVPTADTAVTAYKQRIATLEAELLKQQPARAQAACPECPACQKCPMCFSKRQQREEAAEAEQQPKVTGAATISAPPINLLDVLGPQNGLSSVSNVAYMAYNCAPPLREAFPGLGPPELSQLAGEVLEGLIDAFASSTGIERSEVDTEAGLLANLGLEPVGINDPGFLHARQALSDYAASKVVWIGGKGACCGAKGTQVSREQWGGLQCGPGEGTACMGYLSSSMLFLTLRQMAEAVVQQGYCTDPPEYKEGYANQMTKVRMFNESWHLSNTDTLSEDAIIFSFQLLYEHHTVFLRQYWLGVVAMQNPFDAWSIQDIIYTHKPDLIIESGTANGGSALMWASILHLLGNNGSVITLDLTRPEEMTWAQKRENPWDNPLWQRYVQFIEGSSLDPGTLALVKQAAARAGTVLVLLDSSHQEDHVRQEAAAYCPLATQGSYCIVQDTKLNRLGWAGPRPAVQAFLEQHPEFEADRSRELLFTDHPSGYLKRRS